MSDTSGHESNTNASLASTGRAVNAWSPEYIEEMHAAWQRDPASVGDSWNQFFLGFELGLDRPAAAEGTTASAGGADPAQSKVDALIEAYRRLGHLGATLDPLGTVRPMPQELALSEFGLTGSDLPKTFNTGSLPIGARATLADIVAFLQKAYCGSIGAEFGYISCPRRRAWIAARVEAAALAKVDQGAILVAEFSELQGFAASHYARLAGRSDAVADAVAQQYLPEGPDSPVPSTDAAALLACAEKVDNLVGAFLIGEIPSGSKDPYGLRRAAAGLVRVALEQGWDLQVADVLSPAMQRLREQGADLTLSDADALPALEDFIADRLVHHLGQEGVPQDAVRASLAADPGGMATVADWARALHAHRDDAALVRAGTGANRCRRIIAGSEHGLGGFTSGGDADEDALAAALDVADAAITAARDAGDPSAAIAAAEALGEPVDAFFEKVMVNADDPPTRDRRHALVRRAGEAYGRVADFEVLVLKGGE